MSLVAFTQASAYSLVDKLLF